MTKRDFEMKTDGLGIGLFAFGVFCAVLVVQAMLSGIEPQPTQLVRIFAGLWVNSIGALPSLMFQAVLIVLGARLFLGGPLPTLGRHLMGSAFTAAAFAILCGAFAHGAGGALGDRVGGTLASATHVVVGGLVGALAVGAAVWFLWLPRAPQQVQETFEEDEPEEEAAPPHEDGVSRAEAEALLPNDLQRAMHDARKHAPVIPPSPYPEDVRRRGEIPAGTRPIGTGAAAASAPAATPTGAYRWTAPGVRPLNEPAPRAEPAPIVPEGAQKLAAMPQPLWEEPETPEAPEAPEAEVAEAEVPDDIEVDAYGTPRTLVESLRQARAEAQAEDDDDEVFELDEPETEPEEEAADEALEPPAYSPVASTWETETPEAEIEEELEVETVLEAEPEIEPEVEEELEPDFELDPNPASALPSVAGKVDHARTRGQELLDFDVNGAPTEPVPASSVFVDADEPVAPVREVVLTPPPVAAERAIKAPSATPDGGRAALLAEVGCLFIDRKRVAVSMLQRQYSMDFDDACRVLDELQQMGLIGPYLGGQRRDILLTREQWLERVGAS